MVIQHAHNFFGPKRDMRWGARVISGTEEVDSARPLTKEPSLDIAILPTRDSNTPSVMTIDSLRCQFATPDQDRWTPGAFYERRRFACIYPYDYPGVWVGRDPTTEKGIDPLDRDTSHMGVNKHYLEYRGGILQEHGYENELLPGSQMFERFYDNIVGGWVIGRKFVIKVGADRDQLLAALERLKQAGVDDDAIRFTVNLGDRQEMETLEAIGRLHQAPVYCPGDSAGARAYVEKSCMLTGAGVECLYSEALRSRILLPDQVEALKSVIDSREAFMNSIGEILTGIKTVRPGGEPHFLFFVLDRDMTWRRGGSQSMAVAKLFESFYTAVTDMPPQEWKERSSMLMGQFLSFIAAWKERLPKAFRTVNLTDPDFCQCMYAFLLGVSKLEELKLGPQYTGRQRPLPGGFIGFRDSDGMPRCGPQLVDPKTVDLRDMHSEILNGRCYLVPRRANSGIWVEDSVTYEIPIVGHEMAKRRSMIFSHHTIPVVRALSNFMLWRTPNADRLHVREVMGSLCPRDPLVEAVAKYWQPPRKVYVGSVSTVSGNEEVWLLRRSEYPTYFWQHRFNREGLPESDARARARGVIDFMNEQRLLLKRWGIDPPLVRELLVREQAGDFGQQTVEYVLRPFVPGTPLNSVDMFQDRPAEFWPNMAGCIGRLMALGLAGRRSFFGDGDEIILFNDKDIPCGENYADTTGSFRPLDHASPMQRDVALYAPHLSAYIFAAARQLGDAGAQEFRSSIFESFQRKLSELKEAADVSGDEWLTLIDAGFEPPKNCEPEFDMRRCLPAVLESLASSNIDDVTVALDTEVDKQLAFLPHLVQGITDGVQIRKLVEEAGLLLASAWSQNDRFTQASLMATIEGDEEFPLLSYQERLYRLSALRASSWAHRMMVPIAAVTSFANRCYYDADPNFVAARDHFIREVNLRLAEDNYQSPQFNRELASQFFSSLWEEPSDILGDGSTGERKAAAKRRRRLVEAGYLAS